MARRTNKIILTVSIRDSITGAELPHGTVKQMIKMLELCPDLTKELNWKAQEVLRRAYNRYTLSMESIHSLVISKSKRKDHFYVRAGRLGGLSTYDKYGSDYYKAIGRRGGLKNKGKSHKPDTGKLKVATRIRSGKEGAVSGAGLSGKTNILTNTDPCDTVNEH